MLRRYLLALLAILAMFFSSASYALPFHVFTKPGTQLPTQVQLGASTNAYYTVVNNTADQRNGNYVKHLPPNVTQVISGGTYPDTCGALFNLAGVGQPGDSCTLQLKVSGPVNERDLPDQHLFVCFPKGKTCAGTNDPLNVVQTFPLAIAITPVTASIDSQNTQQYTAIGTFADGLTIDITPLLNWVSSNASVAAISSAGLATGANLTGGVTTISANINGVTSNVARLTVAAAVTITPTPSTNTEVGAAYSQTNVGHGGFTPYTYSISAGTIPAGTTLNTATGTVSGTPTVANTYNYTVRVTDPQGKTATASTSVTIAATVTITGTPSTIKQVGLAYSQTNVASNGIAPFVYSVSAGALPAGTTLNNATGTVSGTPTTAGAFSYTIKVTDGNGQIATVTTTANMTAVLAIAATPPANTIVGAAYSQANTASGGTVPYTYSVTTGALPAGTTLSVTTGTVSGTPTTAGAYNYTIQVVDNNGASASATTSGTIAATLGLVATPSTFTEVGAAYAQTNTASGGVAPLTYSVSVGAIPAGTTLNTATGTVAGTPTTASAFSYMIRVTDADGNVASALTTGTIASAVALTATPPANTIVGSAYSQLNTATGGTAPFTYIVSAGALPAGTTLNASTGTVSGTPTTTGAYSYTIKVTDNDGLTATAASTGTIAATIGLTATASANTMLGATYSQANTVSGGISPFIYSITNGTVPAGTTLNTTTGTVSGTPTTVGGFGYTVLVTDSKGNTAIASSNGTIAPTLTLTPTTSTNTEVGVAYSQTNAGNGGIAPLTYSVSAGTLPAGTTLNSATGTVAGTPATAGAFSYTIKVTDADSNTATATTTGTIAVVLGLTTTPSSNTEVGAAYTQTNAVSGGSAPYTYGLSAGALPPGTTLNTSTGTVSGTPTAAGVFNYTIQVTDHAGATATAQSSGSMSGAITLTAATPPNTMVGAAYSQANTVSGGIAPYTYSVSSGTVPAGTTLNTATGTVSGTPTTAATYSYTIQVTDGFGNAATASTNVTIAATIALTSTPSIFTEVGAVYSQVNTVSGGVSSYTYGLSAGALPAGTSLNTFTGTVSGTPTTAGVFNYTIRVTDQDGNTASAVTSGTMTPTVTIVGTASTDMVVGRAYSQTNQASGGTLPYVYSVSVGSVPAGTTLNTATGTVSGTPTTAGAFSYTVQVTDNDGVHATTASTGTIAAVLGLTATPSTNKGVGAAYSQVNTVSGGKGPFTYSVSAGAVPAGTTLNTTTGTVSGTPTTSGVFNYTITVTDSESFTATAQSTGTIATGVTLAATASPATEVGRPYSQTNVASGGVAPYTYSVSAGTLPSGTTLNPSTGTVSGTANTASAFSYTISVIDSDGASATASTSGTIASTVALTATSSTNTEVGVAYSQANSASGGTTPYTFSVSVGTVPAGTTLNTATGTVAGTPTASGNFSYTIQVTDAAGAIATAATTGNMITAVTLTATPSSNTEINTAYSQTNAGAGGTPPYTYSVATGTLPTGTNLNTTTGTVSGTTTVAGAFSYTIRVADALGATATAASSGTIATAVTLTATPSASTQVGVAYSQTNTATNGNTPYTYTVSAGTVPAGTTLNSAGVVSGTPTTAGAFSYTIQVTDHAGIIATAASSGTIAVALAADRNDQDEKSSANKNASAVEYTFNGKAGDIVNHVRLCLATDATCTSCSEPEDIVTSISMGTPYPITIETLTNYLTKYTSVMNSQTKSKHSYYIGVYVSSTGANCLTAKGTTAYCGTNNVGAQTTKPMCILANSGNGTIITSVSNNGGEVYLTKPAQYVYASNLVDNKILQCVLNVNGSFSNCATIASISNPYATAFVQVNGAQYAYVTATDGNIYQCALSSDGANTFACNVLQHESILPSSPQAIAFLENNHNQYAYVGNANGEVSVCPVSNDGSFGVCHSTAMTNGSNTIVVLALHKTKYIYGINSNGNLEKCAVNLDGTLSTCTIQSAPVGVPTGIGFKSFNGITRAYVTSNSSTGNFVYSANVDANGNLAEWTSTANPVKAANLIGISFVTLNQRLYAYVSTQGGTVYQCSIDRSNGDLNACNLSSTTGATLYSRITTAYALADAKDTLKISKFN